MNSYLLTGVITTFSLLSLIILWGRRSKKTNNDYPKGTVILHQTGRGPFAPSLSPFTVKLETYLRIAKIPYKNVHDKKRGPKGKVPWIEYNDLVIPDSQLIIEYLNKIHKVDLNQYLTPEERSIAVAFQRMVDEHTYWLMVLNRWKYDDEKTVLKLAKWGWLKIKLAISFVNKQTYQQGLGRHNKEELMSILNKDFSSLSDFLGNKTYLLGRQPCELDCSVFGQLSQFRSHLPLSDVTGLFKRYPNLDKYCEQMKSTYWPDWDECILFPEKQNQK